MRKFIIISATATTSLVILAESGIIDSLLVFLLTGSLPGTSIVISPSMMMAGLIAAGWLSITRITSFDTTQIRRMRRLVKRYTTKQERMPKRRYSRI